MIIKVTPEQGSVMTLEKLRLCYWPLQYEERRNPNRDFKIYRIRGDVSEKALAVLQQRLADINATLEVLSQRDTQREISSMTTA